MNVKKILMFMLGSVLAVAMGMAVLNRAKRQIPAIGKVLGE